MHRRVVLEAVCCSLCGGTNSSVVLQGPDRVHAVPGQFTLRRCHACGLIYQNPRPGEDSFDLIYPADYGPYQPIDLATDSPHPDLREACALIKRLQPSGGRLLDIGCGPGTFLATLRQMQGEWQVAGIEPNPQAVAIARQQHLDVQQARLGEAVLDRQIWDAVTLWNVLEHLPDPLETLRQIRQLLRPDGMLYLAVPICDSWDARIFGPYWIGWELPRHFIAFSRTSLRTMLARAGFELVEQTCINGIEYCFTESLRVMLRDRVHRYGLRRLSIATTYSRPFRLLLRPYLKLAAALHRCSVLTVVARKTSEQNA